MKIEWLGHACFRLTTKAGTRVLMDPYDASVGYPVPEKGSIGTDIITVSHGHHDHNAVEWAASPYVLVDQPGCCRVKDVSIGSFSSWHDDAEGQKRGANLIFTVEADGIRFCHLGDLGHLLPDETLKAIGPVDVLAIPVGGFYTLEPDLAVRQAQKIGAGIIIPMHFATEYTGLTIAGPEAFIGEIGGAVETGKSIMDLSDEGPAPGVYLLEPGCKVFA